VKTGIQDFKALQKLWTPVFTGVTAYYYKNVNREAVA
jgi:hypothetical protein